MFISDNSIVRANMLKKARAYFIVSMLVALFGAIYEHFSFGVYSFFMVFAFAIPLILGAVPAMYLGMRERAVMPPPMASKLWRAGIAALTVGSIFQGVIEIYGTDSEMTGIYALIGSLMLISGAISALFKK